MANTTFGELKRLVFLETRRDDGEADLAAEEAINWAHKAIARVQDFEELMILDTVNAFTAISVGLVVNTVGNLGATSSGAYNGQLHGAVFNIVCDGTGTPNTFKWQYQGGAFTTLVQMKTSPILLQNNVYVQFASTTGHTLNNACTITCNSNIYHLINDLKLTLPKDIYSIRLIQDANSRKLVWVPIRDYDAIIPYPQMVGTFKPKWYIQRGMYLEFYPIPDATYPLYIQYSQWPAPLVLETDMTPYINLDDVVVALASEMTLAILQGGQMTGWDQRAQNLLGVALKEEWSRPDQVLIARPFRAGKTRITGEYWLDPFVKEVNQ